MYSGSRDLQFLAQRRWPGLRSRRGRHHVGHQALLARLVLAGHHHRVADLRLLTQGLLDLAQLDAEPADLHLVVDAAQELQLSLRQPTHQIARAIQPRPAAAERVRHEPLRRQLRPPVIAPRQARAANVQLARRRPAAPAARLPSSTYTRVFRSDARSRRRVAADRSEQRRPHVVVSGRAVDVDTGWPKAMQRPRPGRWARPRRRTSSCTLPRIAPARPASRTGASTWRASLQRCVMSPADEGRRAARPVAWPSAGRPAKRAPATRGTKISKTDDVEAQGRQRPERLVARSDRQS